MSILPPDIPSRCLPPIEHLTGPVAFDTETTGLFPDDGATVAVVSVAYRTGGEIVAHAFPFDVGRAADKGMQVQRYSPRGKYKGAVKGDPDGLYGDWDADVNLPLEEYAYLVSWLSRAGGAVGLVGQNVGFDAHHVSNGLRDAIDPRLPGVVRKWPDLHRLVVADTMLAGSVLDPGEFTGLKPTSERLFGSDAVMSASDLNAALVECSKRYGLTGPDGKRYDLVPWETLGPYALDDAILTLRVYEHRRSQVYERSGVESLEISSQMAVSEVLHRVERRGLGPIDRDSARDASCRVSEAIARLHAEIPFSPVTPATARVYFFDHLGLTPWGPGEKHRRLEAGRVVESGSLSTVTCQRMAQDGVAGAYQYGELLNLSSSMRYYVDWPRMASPHDDRMRTSFRQAYVRSGRLSVERIQLQSMPRRLGLQVAGQPLPEPKALIGVPAGVRRMVLDLSQAELRIAALYAGCDAMVQTLAAGQDIHGQTAGRIFGADPSDPDWDEKRSYAKRAVFGCTFGVGVNTYQATIYSDTGTLVPIERCRDVVYGYHRAYPQFSNAYSYWEGYAAHNLQVPTVRGRYSHFSESERARNPMGWARTAWSRRVQGSLAVFVNRWLVEVERITGRYDALVGTVHDSVILDLPEEVADQVAAQVADETATLWSQFFDIPGGADVSEWTTPYRPSDVR